MAKLNNLNIPVVIIGKDSSEFGTYHIQKPVYNLQVNNGLNLIKQFEGLSLKPYLDAVNIPTIGFGNTYYEDGTKVTLKDKVNPKILY